jgi:tetratricopeptide (TPR) repeat protein
MGHTRLGVVRAFLGGIVVGTSIAVAPSQAAFQADAATAQTQEKLNRIRVELFSGTNRTDDAIRELKDILAVDPGSAEGHLLLGIAYRTAGAAEFMGEAVAELRQALAIDPTFVPARFYLAHIYLDLGRFERAREELAAALTEVPRNPQFLTLLGEVERQLKNPRRSLEVLTEALQIDPSSAQTHYYLGLTLFDLARPNEAIKELETVVQSGEKRAEVYLSLGAAYLEAGRLDEGLEILSQATHIDPARPDIRIQLARAYRLKGQLDKAEAQLQVAAPQVPASVASLFVQQRQLEFDLYLEQGLLKVQQGKLAAAADAFRTVLEMDPNHGPTNRHLAEVYLRQGQYARAQDYAARAEKLGFPLAADKRKVLQDGLLKKKQETTKQETKKQETQKKERERESD